MTRQRVSCGWLAPSDQCAISFGESRKHSLELGLCSSRYLGELRASLLEAHARCAAPPKSAHCAGDWLLPVSRTRAGPSLPSVAGPRLDQRPVFRSLRVISQSNQFHVALARFSMATCGRSSSKSKNSSTWRRKASPIRGGDVARVEMTVTRPPFLCTDSVAGR
jgi:hypothetical protein